MNYRIFLKEESSVTPDGTPEHDSTVFELFVEIDKQIYRSNKGLSFTQKEFANADVKKKLIGEMFKEIGEYLDPKEIVR